jgi:hypothetical protein
MKKLLILIPLFLSSAALMGAAVKVKWNPSQLTATQKVCVSSALRANPKATNKQADYYCKCTLEKAASKWAYSDFATNEKKYTQELSTNGTIAKCAKEALQIKS